VGIRYSDGGSEGVVDCSADGLRVVDSRRGASVGIGPQVGEARVSESDGGAVAGRGGHKNVTGISVGMGIQKLLQSLGV